MGMGTRYQRRGRGWPRWGRVLATLVVAAAVASTVGSAPAVASNDTPDESGAECVPLTSISIVRASNGPRVTFRGYTYCHNLTGFVLKINTGIGSPR